MKYLRWILYILIIASSLWIISGRKNVWNVLDYGNPAKVEDELAKLNGER